MQGTSEIAGFTASALVLATFAMRNMRALRFTAVLSNVAFIIYGGLNGLAPVLLLHLLLLPLNLYRLASEQDTASAPEAGAGRALNKATQMAIEALHLADAMRAERQNSPKTARISLPS